MDSLETNFLFAESADTPQQNCHAPFKFGDGFDGPHVIGMMAAMAPVMAPMAHKGRAPEMVLGSSAVLAPGAPRHPVHRVMEHQEAGNILNCLNH